jgi:hypothetical protein
MHSVVIIDTNVLCAWLKVPGKETCGSGSNLLDYKVADSLVKERISSKSTFVLPLAVIIETGNHISQAPADRYEAAKRLAALMAKTAEQESPWAAFVHQTKLWDAAEITRLSEEWPELAKAKLSMGDVTIKRLAEFYAQSGFTVELMTADDGLKAYEPTKKPLIPRRRS